MGRAGRKPTVRTSAPFCDECGDVLVKKEREYHCRFANRKFCGHKCSQLARTTIVKHKDCEHCGEALLQKEKEYALRFASRRFCGHKCMGLSYRRNITIEGLEMTREELAEMVGVSEGCICTRYREGRNLLTGKRKQ